MISEDKLKASVAYMKVRLQKRCKTIDNHHKTLSDYHSKLNKSIKHDRAITVQDQLDTAISIQENELIMYNTMRYVLGQVDRYDSEGSDL